VEQGDGKPPDHVATVTDRALHPIGVLCLLECYEYQASGTVGRFRFLVMDAFEVRGEGLERVPERLEH
jgi:hypothetical protein